jgi:transglutaminase-like putative cysteine protease
MKVRIAHRTVYRYRDPPRHLVQTLRLTPVDTPGQRVLDWRVTTGAELWREVDAWGNVCHGHTLDHPGRVLVIYAGGEVETAAQPERVDHAGVEPALYLRPSQLATADPAIVALARASLSVTSTREASRLADAPHLLALADLVGRAVVYRPGVTHAATTAAQALHGGAGVCQDQAHVYIAACRSLGFAARYVSGYFVSDRVANLGIAVGTTTDANCDTHAGADVRAHCAEAASAGASRDGGPGTSHASHAWAEVCVAPAERRWLAVDVTHGCLTDERHVRLAHGPDYGACLPVRGVRIGGDGETLDVDIRISQI